MTGTTDGNRIKALVAGNSESGPDWVQENGSFNVIDSSIVQVILFSWTSYKYTYQWNHSNGATVVNDHKEIQMVKMML